jgi:hypothetical protein
MAVTAGEALQIAIRIVVEGPAVALAGANVLRDILGPLAKMTELGRRPYPKFPDAHEITCALWPTAAAADSVYDEVVKRLGSGWTPDTADDFARWTIWNRGDGAFAVPDARWAHVELIRR